jgi:hypothetical protein
MSWGPRITNWFLPPAQTPDSSVACTASLLGDSHAGQTGTLSEIGSRRYSTSQDMAPRDKDDEYEGRPPYLHVRITSWDGRRRHTCANSGLY